MGLVEFQEVTKGVEEPEGEHSKGRQAEKQASGPLSQRASSQTSATRAVTKGRVGMVCRHQEAIQPGLGSSPGFSEEVRGKQS